MTALARVLLAVILVGTVGAVIARALGSKDSTLAWVAVVAWVTLWVLTPCDARNPGA